MAEDIELILNECIATHNGTFHADEIMGIATLQAVFGNMPVLRTRDKSLYEQAKFLVDVGMVYEPEIGRFDHHQRTDVGSREDGVPYASAGLVWKSYGLDAVKNLAVSPLSDIDLNTLLSAVDVELMRWIDAVDCGVDLPEGKGAGISTLLASYNPSCGEYQAGVSDEDSRFSEALQVASQILRNTVRRQEDILRARSYIQSFDNGEEILILDHFMPWREIVIAQMPHIKFVVFPNTTGNWCVQTVPINASDKINRTDLPLEWAGLANTELERICGIAGSLFCHINRFICVHRTRIGAITMANKALLIASQICEDTEKDQSVL